MIRISRVFTIIMMLIAGFALNVQAQKKDPSNKPAYCTVYTIAANEKPSKLPAELKSFAHIFSKMPFKVFRTFKLKQKNSITVHNKYSVSRVSTRYSVAVKLLERILGTGDKLKFRLQLQVRKVALKDPKRTLTIHDMVMKLHSGKPVFIAGPKDGTDTLLFGLICK